MYKFVKRSLHMHWPAASTMWMMLLCSNAVWFSFYEIETKLERFIDFIHEIFDRINKVIQDLIRTILP